MNIPEEIKTKVNKRMKAIKKMLSDNDLLTEADEMNLNLLEEEFIVYELCNQDIEKNGVCVLDHRGYTKTNPAMTMRNKSINTILNILKEYSISTKSRKLLLQKNIDVETEETGLKTFMKTLSR